MSEQLTLAYRDLVSAVTGVLPRIALGIALAIALVLTAQGIRRLARGACRRAKVDSLSESLGLSALVKRIGVREPASEWIPGLVYAGSLALFAQTAATMLGLTPIADAIRAFFAYLPNVMTAVAVLLAGSAAADFAGSAVRRAAEDSGIDLATTLGSVTSGLILFVTGIMALAQLQIDTAMIRIVTICALGGIALAFGLSVGLGSRDVTRGMIAAFYARKILRPGDAVTMEGAKGTLVAITPTQTLIETPGGEHVAVANAKFLETAVAYRSAPDVEA